MYASDRMTVKSQKHCRINSLEGQGDLYTITLIMDRLCGLVVRVLGYRSGGLGSIPGTTRKRKYGSGTGSTQPREYN
jgi:hypothetical protein